MYKRCENANSGPVTYPDLLQLRQTNYILIMSRIDQGKLTVEEAGVQIAQINSQIATEGERRLSASRMVGAQEQAIEAQRQAAFAQSLSEAGAKFGQKPRPSSRTIDCDTRPVGSGSTTSCTEN